VQIVLTHDVPDMSVHRALGDVELVRNFTVLQTASEQRDQLPLARGGCCHALSEDRTHRLLRFDQLWPRPSPIANQEYHP